MISFDATNVKKSNEQLIPSASIRKIGTCCRNRLQQPKNDVNYFGDRCLAAPNLLTGMKSLSTCPRSEIQSEIKVDSLALGGFFAWRNAEKDLYQK
jgi:hypothetical protein